MVCRELLESLHEIEETFIALSNELRIVPLHLLYQIDSVRLLKWYLGHCPSNTDAFVVLVRGYIEYNCVNCLEYICSLQ